MIDKISKGLLVLVMTAGLLLGAYLCAQRYFYELQDKTVELCVDLNDLKKMAAVDHRPLTPILQRIRQAGFTSIGVFEETLPEANAAGEVYYAKGSGIKRLAMPLPGLAGKALKPDHTYIYAPDEAVRRRLVNHLEPVFGPSRVKMIGRVMIDLDEPAEELHDLGVGMSEQQTAFLNKLGFTVVPRLWADPRFQSGNMDSKLLPLSSARLVIFDGEEIIGYPDQIKALAGSLKAAGLKFGYIEIIKQYGSKQLAGLMDKEIIKVHSIAADEIKKVSLDEAVERFTRAAQERKVKLLYVRPFLPPQTAGAAVDYNLAYFNKIQNSLRAAGYVLGRAEMGPAQQLKGWQIMLLGLSVIIGALFLLNLLIPLASCWMYLVLLLSSLIFTYLGVNGYNLWLQKGLSLLAALIFPAYAVISSFRKSRLSSSPAWEAVMIVINILAETMIGVFLMVGLLADYRFLTGTATFTGVKIALVLPILTIAGYFILRSGEGTVNQKIRRIFELKISLGLGLGLLLVIGLLAVLLARSGNFILPVPGVEKAFRSLLQTVLYIRPRTKEFFFGYPVLYLAAIYFLRGRTRWLWLLASLGAIAPLSVFNTFSHIHVPLLISLIRTFNGLLIGLFVGFLVYWLVNRFIKWDEA
jgi:hypothetical protein